MYTDEVIDAFLLDIKNIKIIYEKEKIKRDNFNVFDILRMERMETKHSAFLAELLNPNGAHKKGDLFLKNFCERMGFEALSRVRVSCEKSIETKSYGKGRIDIYVEDLNQGCGIIIENKIYAKDQQNQLAKYHEYDPKAHICYLTLDGRQASVESLRGLKDDDYFRISYETFVIDWLDECLKSIECVEICRLRGVLEQYVEHLKWVTNQYLSNEEKMEILKKVCSSDDSMLLYYYLMQARNSVEQEFEKRMLRELENVCKRKNVELLFNDVYKKNRSLRKKYSGFDFKLGNKILSFEFEEIEYNGLIVGVKKCNLQDGFCKNVEDVLKGCLEGCSCECNDKWIYAYWERYQPWTIESRGRVLGGKFAEDLCRVVEKILLDNVNDDMWK